MQKSFSSINVPSSNGGVAAVKVDHQFNRIQQSQSMNNCGGIEKGRGFKPSDRHDPAKREFLTDLSKQIWQRTEESSSSSSTTYTKKVDLQKIFTPANDVEEILPKNRNLYASSAFYSPHLHPTVETQVELARRISHSLSDVSNKQSKGQSMYVNRKKRSVKWVHEGSGKAQPQIDEYSEETKENEYESKKDPLKLIMNPRGKVKDLTSLREPLSETGLLSPDRCAKLVQALNEQKGRGAELFAKRRRKAEKWIVEEYKAGSESPAGLNDKPLSPSPASMVPAYSDVGIHRVQLNMQQDQIQDKYVSPSVKLIKSPWDAALETGDASNAFVEGQTSQVPQPITLTSSGHRNLAYKPSIPQGWKAPAVVLPKEYQLNVGEEVSSAAKACEDLIRNEEEEIIKLLTKTELTHSEPLHQIEEEHYSFAEQNNAIRELENALNQFDKHQIQESVYDSADKMMPKFRTSISPIDEKVGKVETKKEEDEEEDYRKVPVRDLISCFEQQVEKIAAENQVIAKPAVKKHWVIDSQEEEDPREFLREKNLEVLNSLTIEDKQKQKTEIVVEDKKLDVEDVTKTKEKEQNKEDQHLEISKELFVPKAVPMQSYAPPPDPVQYLPARSGFPVKHRSSPTPSSGFPASVETKPYSGFLKTNPTADPFNQAQSPISFSKPEARKSPHLAPGDFYEHSIQQQKQSTPRVSPVNFSPSPLSYEKLAKFDQPDPSSLLHCQNFNVSARGWSGAQRNQPYRPLVVTPLNNLRYSDF